MNSRPMTLRLRSGSETPSSLRRKRPRRVHEDDLQVQPLGEALAHLLRLLLAEQAVVDEDAGEAVADRALHDERRDGRVDAARERADHAALRAHLLADPRRRLLDEGARVPVAPAAGDVEEVREDLGALLRVHDLGVEQDAVELARRVLDRRDRVGLGRARDAEAGGRAPDVVAVARPDAAARRQAAEERSARRRREHGLPVLAVPRALHLAAQHVAHELHAVADADDRHAELEDLRVAARRLALVDAVRPAREHDAARVAGLERLGARRGRQDLGVDRHLAQPARDQLGELGAAVEDEYGVSLHEPRGSRDYTLCVRGDTG
jgi:hypothetical protein